MIKDDFLIDFDRLRIYHNPKGNHKIYTINDLYSYLQDVFDEPENMKYDIPIIANSKTSYSLINGWTIDPDSLKFLKGTLKSPASS